jgi:diguanylate cyclase (GGDEF)-like protein
MLIAIHVQMVFATGLFAVMLVWKRKLFLVGDVIRYGIWVVLGMLILTVIAYVRGGSWLLWALSTAFALLASVMISTFVQLNRAIKEASQTTLYKEYALTDIMTGLKSRYAYTIFEAQQKMGAVSNDLCLIFLDVDMLKQANDTLGHAAGDELIIATSKCIQTAFGDVAECFRMGGDEFLIAMTLKPDAIQERIALFDRLVAQWRGRYVDGLTVSYGVVTASEYPDLNFEALLKAADEKMYQRKKQQNERS